MGTTFEITLAALVIPALGWRWLLILSAIPSFLICILMKVNILLFFVDYVKNI